MAEKLYIPTKKGPGDHINKVLSIRIREELANEIDLIAEKTNRSRNELIGILLEYAVKNIELDADRKS